MNTAKGPWSQPSRPLLTLATIAAARCRNADEAPASNSSKTGCTELKVLSKFLDHKPFVHIAREAAWGRNARNKPDPNLEA